MTDGAPSRGTAPPRPPRQAGWLVEAILVSALALVVTVLMYRGLLQHLSTSVPVDPTWDPLYFAWQLAWAGHAVATDPGGLWTTNVFLREPGNLAFTDTVLGYLPVSLLTGTGGMADAIRGLNIAMVIATVTAFTGAYALSRTMGARIAGALVAGAGFAFAPWRVQQIDHINVLSTGGMALTLALLAYGHGWSLKHGWRPERMRPGWIWVAWAVACWQITFGFAIGVIFGYVLGAVMVLWLLGWLLLGRARPRLPLRLLVAHAVGGAAFLAVTATLAVPYLHALAKHPEAQRTEAYLGLFSPRWLGFFTGSEWSTWYIDNQDTWRAHLGWVNETVLLPGYLLMGLAVLGLLLSGWTLRRRLILAAVILVVAVLAMGVAAPGGGEYTFLPLWHHLPGWNSIRTPGRLIIWITLGLCLLAAGAVSRIADLVLGTQHEPRFARMRPEPTPGSDPGTDGHDSHVPGTGGGSETDPEAPVLRPRRSPSGAFVAAGLSVLLALPAVAVTVEGHGDTAARFVSPAPWNMRSLKQPVLVIPSQPLVDYQIMLWGTEGWPVMANGSSGFDPVWINELRTELKGFPDPYSVYDIQKHGIKTVVLIKGWLPGTPLEGAQNKPIDELGITKLSDGEVTIYRIP